MKILLCCGPNEEDNLAALSILERVPDVRITRDTAILAGKTLLPYILVLDSKPRENYHGLESIREFIESL